MAQPTVFTLQSTEYTDKGRTRISWTYAPSANHYSYRIYRVDPDAALPVLIAEFVDNTASYYDYYAPVGVVAYAVVEVTAVASVQTEEARVYKSVTLPSGYYWLLHPTDATKHIQLRNISGDDFKNEREVEVKKLIGRGRKVDVGDDWGKTGSLSGRIYNRADKTARQTRLDIEAAVDLVSHWYLRNPFGDVWKIWFEDPSFSRIAGHGSSEFVEISFNYYEVA